MRTKLTATALALALATTAVVPGALAEPKGEKPAESAPMSTQAPEMAPVTDAELSAFAEAAAAIEEIRKAHVADMRAAQEEGDQARMQEIMQEVRAKATAELEEIAEMDPERYSEIAVATRSKPELRERVMSKIEEVREDAEGAQ